MTQLQSVTCRTWSHSVTCHLTQVNTLRFNPSQSGWYSIYLPQRDGRLIWPSGSRTSDLLITSPTLNHCTTKTTNNKRDIKSWQLGMYCMLWWTVGRCERSSPGIGRAPVWDACTEQGCYTMCHIRPWSAANQVHIICDLVFHCFEDVFLLYVAVIRWVYQIICFHCYFLLMLTKRGYMNRDHSLLQQIFHTS